jgi:hypothetical protein
MAKRWNVDRARLLHPANPERLRAIRPPLVRKAILARSPRQALMFDVCPQPPPNVLHVTGLPACRPRFVAVASTDANNEVVQLTKVFLLSKFVKLNDGPERPVCRHDMPVQPDGFLDDGRAFAPPAKCEQELRSLLRQHGPVDDADHVSTRRKDAAVQVVAVEDHRHTVLSWTAENALFVRSR